MPKSHELAHLLLQENRSGGSLMIKDNFSSSP